MDVAGKTADHDEQHVVFDQRDQEPFGIEIIGGHATTSRARSLMASSRRAAATE